MTTDLRCYGDDIQGLADLVPDFDLRSPMDVESWYPREWQAIADTLGFAQQIAAAPRAMPSSSRSGLVMASHTAATGNRRWRSKRIVPPVAVRSRVPS